MSFWNSAVNLVGNTEEVGRKLIQYTRPALAEKMREVYNDGGTLNLGPLQFSRENGFRWTKFFRRRELPLNQVAAYIVGDGSLSLVKVGERRPTVNFSISAVPNVFALIELMKAVGLRNC